ncbi:hypothetical protein VPH35_026451 [Triticum aestivum]
MLLLALRLRNPAQPRAVQPVPDAMSALHLRVRRREHRAPLQPRGEEGVQADPPGPAHPHQVSDRVLPSGLAGYGRRQIRDAPSQPHHRSTDRPPVGDHHPAAAAGGHILSFARVGAESWTWLPPHTSYDDCMYKNGLMHAVTSNPAPVATMKIIMEGPLTYRYLISMYIIQAPWGHLLQVWRKFGGCDLGETPQSSVFWITGKIRVYKVDTVANELERTSCLRGHALFLGHNQSLCLSTEEYPALKANHAYFTDDCRYWTMGLQNNRRDMGILNLDDNSSEELVSPHLWSNRPAPIWITLNLREINFNLDN